MIGRLKKTKLPLKIELFTIRWYPSNRSCSNPPRAGRNVRPEHLPPLMVRKPDWRR